MFNYIEYFYTGEYFTHDLTNFYEKNKNLANLLAFSRDSYFFFD